MTSNFRLSHILQWPVLIYLIVSSSYIVSNEKLPQTRARTALHSINLLVVLAFVLYPIVAIFVNHKIFSQVQLVLLILTLVTSICIAALEYKGDDSQRNDKLDKKLKVNSRLAIANVAALLLLYFIQKDYTGDFYKKEKEEKETKLAFLEKEGKAKQTLEEFKEKHKSLFQTYFEFDCMSNKTKEEIDEDPFKCTQIIFAHVFMDKFFYNKTDPADLKNAVLRHYKSSIQDLSRFRNNSFLPEEINDMVRTKSRPKGEDEKQEIYEDSQKELNKFLREIDSYGSQIYDQVLQVKDNPEDLVKILDTLIDCNYHVINN